MGQLALDASERPPMATGLDPPLKWAGGKRWLLPAVKTKWETAQDARLVEPFAGGLSIALGIAPSKALLNDINEHVINFYKHLQRGLRLEADHIDVSPSADNYYQRRKEFNDLINAKRAVGIHDDGRQAARLFYYLNRNCYNGLCRFNRDGLFNTPHGKYVKPRCDTDLTRYKPVMKGWQFSAKSFEEMTLAKSDFVYADPPYDDAFTGYSRHSFGMDKQEALARWLARHKGPVVLSNHATDRILRLYESLGFDTSMQVPAPRMIHCQGDRTPAMEVVATLNI